jgi:hypothetical protein
MKFNPERIINRIQVPIVRVCNRKCPDCCARFELTWYNKNLDKPREVSLEELKRAGELFGELEAMEITGGEPTMHSQFEELTENLRNYFNCKTIILVSNGWLFGRDSSKLPLLLKYDGHLFTYYGETFDAANHTGTNTEAIKVVTDYMREHDPNWSASEIHDHIPQRSPPYPGGACAWNSSNMISYYEGKLYGCCLAWSLEDKGHGIPLTKNWREEVTKIVLPCETCYLSI